MPRVALSGFSALHRVFDKLPALPKPLPTPQSLPVADKAPNVSDTLAGVAQLRLVQLPKRPNGEVIDWSAPLREAWDISESGALNIMEQFLSEGGNKLAILLSDTVEVAPRGAVLCAGG